MGGRSQELKYIDVRGGLRIPASRLLASTPGIRAEITGFTIGLCTCEERGASKFTVPLQMGSMLRYFSIPDLCQWLWPGVKAVPS